MTEFETRVDQAYAACLAEWTLHEDHLMWEGSIQEKTCKVDDQCDRLTQVFGDHIDRRFPPDEARLWLYGEIGPDDLLDWPLGDSCDDADTVGEAVVTALAARAWSLIFPVQRTKPGPVRPEF